jgi:O-succinylbenzoate synthase
MPGWNVAHPTSENTASAPEMTVIARDWLAYQLPFKQAWQTSHATLTARCGELLRLRTEDGRVGWGDYAPLPDFGISAEAARLFALETAYLDLAAQAAGIPLNSFLSDQPPLANATVHSNLGAISNITPDDLGSAIEQGFQVLKIKTGIGHWRDEIDHIQTLCRHLPTGARLRLDANAAWSTVDAEAFIAACAKLPIEGLEEPLNNPSHEALRHLQQLAGFPLAIDESTQLINKRFFAQPPVRRLVLKPARHGGLLPTLEIALRAQAAGIECIVTSSLESVCGVLACAHLAVAIAPQSVHGLATGDWFSEDTGEPLIIKNGQLILPTQAGLGFSFNEKTGLT